LRRRASTTAILRDFGYMSYDPLLAQDSSFKIHADGGLHFSTTSSYTLTLPTV